MNSGIYLCAAGTFLEICTHLFLPYVSNLRITNEFTDLLFSVCSHYQKLFLVFRKWLLVEGGLKVALAREVTELWVCSYSTTSSHSSLGPQGALLQYCVQQQTTDQEDGGFTDDSLSTDEKKLSGDTSIWGSDLRIGDVGLCQAIELVFTELTQIAVVRQNDCGV